MDRLKRRLLPLLYLSTLAAGGELAPPTTAKFIRVIATASGSPQVACADREIAGELATLGVATEANAKVAWAGSLKDVKQSAAQHRLVICPNPDWLPEGAAVAITAEGGRPSIYLSMKSLASAGITLPDSIVKISKVVK